MGFTYGLTSDAKLSYSDIHATKTHRKLLLTDTQSHFIYL